MALQPPPKHLSRQRKHDAKEAHDAQEKAKERRELAIARYKEAERRAALKAQEPRRERGSPTTVSSNLAFIQWSDSTSTVTGGPITTGTVFNL